MLVGFALDRICLCESNWDENGIPQAIAIQISLQNDRPNYTEKEKIKQW